MKPTATRSRMLAKSATPILPVPAALAFLWAVMVMPLAMLLWAWLLAAVAISSA